MLGNSAMFVGRGNNACEAPSGLESLKSIAPFTREPLLGRLTRVTGLGRGLCYR